MCPSIAASTRHARAALLGCFLLLAACMAQQDPTDFPYRTSSILRHANGQMQRAYLIEPTDVESLPCQRWCWWYDDGRIDNVELSRDLVLQGCDFPAGSRIFFDREGRLAHAWLSRDSLIDGHLCRGGMKIDTAFHPNGRVKAFFPRRTTEIDGVPCTASVFHPIYLHPDGTLRQCKLAEDMTRGGETIEKGSVVVFDEAGRVVR